MKTEPNASASLSEAIILGAKIAKECGIEQSTGSIFKFNYDYDNKKICQACTAGLALIGRLGVETIEKRLQKRKLNSYELFHKQFNPSVEKVKSCLLKTLTTEEQKAFAEHSTSVYGFIVNLNDGARLKARTIAAKLQKCGL